jgi:cytoskeletal protein CcmA (bactofilin family)
MARQTINIGSTANDGTGDPLRTAFDKINDNFAELYGTDGDSDTLAGDLDINGWNIVSTRSNEDIRILPAGTGGVIASAVRIAGTTISSDDSTQITIAENVQTTGTLNVSGAATIDGALSSGTSLTLATGATVTGIDNGTLATGSATLLATQGAIKTYIDAQNTAQDLDFACDDSTALSIDLDDEVMQFSGGNGINTSGSGNTVTIAIDTGTVATLTDSQVLTNKTLTAPTINGATMTGNVTVDNITLNDNIISSASNADLILDPSGTGDIKLTATSTDITGNASVSGTLSTADITTTGNQTISGSLTTGTLNIGDLNIDAQGRITTDTNGDVDIEPSGTGAINLTGPTNVTGTATVTGQLDVDNLTMNANTISSTTGGITISPLSGETLALGGTDSIVTAFELQATLGEFTTLRTDSLQNDTSDGDISISTQGTGVVDFNTATQSTIGANGAASALTANPVGYLKIKIAGADRIIPFYNA